MAAATTAVDSIESKTVSEWLVKADPPIQESPLREPLSEVDEWQARASHWLGFCLRFDTGLDPEQVKLGLARTLYHIPALGARVDILSNAIQYELVLDKDNQGVVLEYIEATCSDMNLLPSDAHTRDYWKRAGLDAPSARFSNAPTLQDPLLKARLIVVNKAISYLSIGISHGLCDGTGVCDVLQIWSHFCTHETTDGLPDTLKTRRVFFKRVTTPHRPADTVKELQDRLEEDVGTCYNPYSARTFFIHLLPRVIWCMSRQEVLEVRVSEVRLQQLKDRIMSKLPDGEWVSRFQVMCAAMLMAQRATQDNTSITHRLHVACDLRGRAQRFPKDYFGNAAFDFHETIELPSTTESKLETIITIAQQVHNVIQDALKDPEAICKTKDWYEAARHLGYKNKYDIWEPVVMDILRGEGSFVNRWDSRWLDVSMGSATTKASAMAAYFGVLQNIFVQVPRHSESGDSTIYLALPSSHARRFAAYCQENKDLLPFDIVKDE